jgi:MoxR-like ATPase
MSSEETSTVFCPNCGRAYDVPAGSSRAKARCKCGCKFNLATGEVIDQDTAPGVTPPPARTAPAKVSKEAAHSVTTDGDVLAQVEALGRTKDALLAEVGKAIIGQKDVLNQILVAFFARGHCLLMGVPGLAKTLMVHSLAQTMRLEFKRIQFTPDLMPTDITGTHILQRDHDTGERRFVFQKGPVFTNVLLADEINRTPPKRPPARSMQERRVTAPERRISLPSRFPCAGYQNPLELEGTFPAGSPTGPLPAAGQSGLSEPGGRAADSHVHHGPGRGLLRSLLDASNQSCRSRIWSARCRPGEHVANMRRVVVPGHLPQTDEAPADPQYVRFGQRASAGQSLILAAKAHVVLRGRFNVSCDDIRAYALPVLRHRVILNFAAASEGLDADAVIQKLLEAVGEQHNSE